MTEPTADPYSAAAGAIIRRARKNAGLSLTQAAAKMAASGIFPKPPSGPALRSYEAGERRLYFGMAVRIAKALGIPPASLMPSEPADEPLILTEDMVDLLIAIGDAFRAQRRSRYALLTEAEPDDTADGPR